MSAEVAGLDARPADDGLKVGGVKLSDTGNERRLRSAGRDVYPDRGVDASGQDMIR
jgi:hypothetical protein